MECVRGERNAQQKAEKSETPGPRSEKAFLLLPTRCTGQALKTRLEGDSWPAPGAPTGFTLPPQEAELVPEITGCESLEFSPKIAVTPERHEASTPSRLNVNVQLPQTGAVSEAGRAESAVKATTLTLPEGVLLNPGAAAGLLTCSPGVVGLKPGFPTDAPSVFENTGFSNAPPRCPEAAKVGTVRIKTPLLNHEIEGAVYLAEQNTNPFAPPLVLYLLVNDEADGILVKLAGTVTPNLETGQLTSVFTNTPQLPFEDLEVEFFSGERASVSTPPFCGNHISSGSFTPWSGNPAVPVSTEHEEFLITSGPHGSPCPGQLL